MPPPSPADSLFGTDLDATPALPVRALPLHSPGAWLRAGWADFRRAPLPGLLHGLATALFGWLVLALAHDRFWLLAGAFSGFLLVAPLAATGLYGVSRALARGQAANLRTVLQAWRPNKPGLMAFGLLLALAGTGWVVTSAGLITLLAPAPVNSPLDFIRVVVLSPHGWLFELWLLLGGVLSAPVFASSVVSIPLLLDRRIGVWGAVAMSWRVVLAQPALMALWAGLLIGISLIGLAPALLGLPLVVPLLAHASWHAYVDLVDASALAARS